MRRVRDPALFLSIYLDKHRAPTGFDPRQVILEEVDKFVEKYKLEVDVAPQPRGAVGIDLASVHRTPAEYHLLFRAQTELRRPPSGTFYQCLAYVYTDALVVQFAMSRFSDWVGALTTGWNELVGELHAGFDGTVLDAAHDMTFGASAVYWTIADGHKDPEEYRDEVRVLAEDHGPLRTMTDLGPLWHCDRPLFPNVEKVSQDLWMLVTPRTAEPDVNKRYHRPRVEYPPDFAVVALASHKIRFEWQQYLAMRKKLERLHRVLDQHVHQILEVQARLGPELNELRSENGIDFQRKLARTANRLASYSGHVSQAKELRRTLIINHRNYLINSVALISSSGVRQVIRSRDQEHAAAEFLDGLDDNEIFATNLGQSQGKCSQLDSDLEYDDFSIARYNGTLRSATDQLKIAGERELGEIGLHISVDSAAVVASVAAILIIELVVKRSSEPSSQEPAANVWELALAVVIGAFAFTQVLSSGCRGKRLERYSVAFAAGFLGAWLASLVIGMAGFPRSVYSFISQTVAFVLGFLVGGTLHSRLSHRLARRRRRDFQT